MLCYTHLLPSLFGEDIPVDQTLERLSVDTTKTSYLHCVINGQACCNRTTYPVEKQNMTT